MQCETASPWRLKNILKVLQPIFFCCKLTQQIGLRGKGLRGNPPGSEEGGRSFRTRVAAAVAAPSAAIPVFCLLLLIGGDCDSVWFV